MKSTQKQFCKIIRYCMKQYSEDTLGRLAELLNTHERVIQIEKMIDLNPTEQEFLKMLDEAFPIVEEEEQL